MVKVMGEWRGRVIHMREREQYLSVLKLKLIYKKYSSKLLWFGR